MRSLLVALALVLAGCATPAPTPTSPIAPIDDEGWSVRALGAGEGHDHADPAQHAGLSTPNFEVVGYDPLLSPDYGGTTPGGYLCGDAKEVTDGRRLAVVESRSDVAFAIADITDAAAPKWLGELVMRTTHIYDVTLVPDGKHVLAITSGIDQPQKGPLPTLASGPAMEWRGPCGNVAIEDPIPRPPSVLLVSIVDPAKPTIIDHWPTAGFGHSIESAMVDGKRLVIASTVATGGSDTFDLFEIVDTPLGQARLQHLSTIPGGPAELGTDVGGHSEGWITKHPATGKTVAYLQSRATVRIVDLADPMNPKELGKWTDRKPGREAYTGPLHSVFPLPEMRDGKHYTVIGPEWVAKPGGVPTGVVFVVDDTDPAEMKEVAAWTLPHDVEWTGQLMWSTHYLTVVDDTLFVSMYHGGVWAIDISDLGDGTSVKMLPSVGVFLPTNVSPKPPTKPVRWTPTLEEVTALPDGTLVTFDSNSGLYTFRFDATRPMMAPAPWVIPGLSG